MNRVLKGLGCDNCEISILLVDDNTMSEMNKRYLNRQGTTNVLAFPMRKGLFFEINPRLLGDVVISVETAAREAKEAKIDVESRLTYLLVHGILHLVGFDHENSGRDEEIMEEKARELLLATQNKFNDY